MWPRPRFRCSTIGLYLGFRLFAGRLRGFPDLQLVTTVMATLAFLTVIFGNWIYIPYRAKDPNSPKTYINDETIKKNTCLSTLRKGHEGTQEAAYLILAAKSA